MLPPGSFSLATFWFDIHERSEKEPFKPPTNHPTHRDANAVRSLQLSRTLLYFTTPFLIVLVWLRTVDTMSRPTLMSCSYPSWRRA